MWRICSTLLRVFQTFLPGSQPSIVSGGLRLSAQRCLNPSLLLLGFSVLLTGCGETEVPAQQRAYQPVPRLSAEDENLIFGDATHVDIYDQLSVGPSDLLETSEDPEPEKSTPGDANLFFGDAKPTSGDAPPLFGDPAPVSNTPVVGQTDSFFSDKIPADATPLTESEPLDDAADDPAELGSVEKTP